MSCIYFLASNEFFINLFKHVALFMGHQQAVHIQIKGHIMLPQNAASDQILYCVFTYNSIKI